MSERDTVQMIELDIGDVHCTLLFLKENNPNYKEDVLRILNECYQKRNSIEVEC